MKKYGSFFGALFVLPIIAGCAANAMQGHWQFSDGATVIGLNIQDEKECELSLSRFVRDDLKKACRYEVSKKASKTLAPQGKQGYLLFLKDDAGHCDVFPDFEFVHNEAAGLVTFIVGDTPFVMQKKEN